jgi:hypothetical protein
VLLAGDLFTSRKGQLRKPMAMFTADMAEALLLSGSLNQQDLKYAMGNRSFNQPNNWTSI